MSERDLCKDRDGGKATCRVMMLMSAWEGEGKGGRRNVYIPLSLTGGSVNFRRGSFLFLIQNTLRVGSGWSFRERGYLLEE